MRAVIYVQLHVVFVNTGVWEREGEKQNHKAREKKRNFIVKVHARISTCCFLCIKKVICPLFPFENFCLFSQSPPQEHLLFLKSQGRVSHSFPNAPLACWPVKFLYTHCTLSPFIIGLEWIHKVATCSWVKLSEGKEENTFNCCWQDSLFTQCILRKNSH